MTRITQFLACVIITYFERKHKFSGSQSISIFRWYGGKAHMHISCVPVSQSSDTNPRLLLAQVKQPIVLVAGEGNCCQHWELLDNQREIQGETQLGEAWQLHDDLVGSIHRTYFFASA